MKIEYSLVILIVGLLYALVKQFLPDLPVSDVVFQTVLLYLLAKLGVIIVGSPAASIRKMFGKAKG